MFVILYRRYRGVGLGGKTKLGLVWAGWGPGSESDLVLLRYLIHLKRK